MAKKKIEREYQFQEWCDYWSIQFNHGVYFAQVRWNHYTGGKNINGSRNTESYFEEKKDGFKTYDKALDFIKKTIGEENI